MIKEFQGKKPHIDESCFVAETAVIIGDVCIGRHSSIWYGVVIRGDINYVKIGGNTNIQDNAVCHVNHGDFPLIIGDHVTVGHSAVIHACTVESHCLIGMGALVMDGAVVGGGSIIAAGSVVVEGAEIPPRSLVAGVPAKVKRELTAVDLKRIDKLAENYLELRDLYLGAYG